MTIEKYERSFEQNEELGLNDLKTEDYGEKEILCQHQLEAADTPHTHLYVKVIGILINNKD